MLVQPAYIRLRTSSSKVEPERFRLRRGLTLANHFDRGPHTTFPTEHSIGKRHDTKVGSGSCRRLTQSLRDRQLVTLRVERACRDECASR
jgi:hypothetical protein